MSCVMTSDDTESSVTRTASFLVVPASRSECASTRAPGRPSRSALGSHNSLTGGYYDWRLSRLTREIGICQEKLFFFPAHTERSQSVFVAWGWTGFRSAAALERVGVGASRRPNQTGRRPTGDGHQTLTLAYTSSPPCAAIVRRRPRLAASGRKPEQNERTGKPAAAELLEGLGFEAE